jgi:cytochrome c5
MPLLPTSSARSATWALVLALATVGCSDDQAAFSPRTAKPDALMADADTVGPALRSQFEVTVRPVLTQFCASCHSGANGPAFLPAAADWYDAVTTWPGLVNVTDPRASTLVTRGAHAGPALTDFQTRTVLAWLEAEAMQRGGWTPPQDAMVVDAAPMVDAADPLAEARVAARAAFDLEVSPVLSAVCTACHQAAGPGQGFLTPNPDAYTTVLNWPGIIDLERPTRSRLLTRGPHAGPGLTETQHDTVLRWIELEVAARGRVVEQDPETPSFAPILGDNSVDLSPLGLAGATLNFRAELLAAGLYVSSIQVTAGASGARLVHPLFVVWKAGVPQPDPVDSFAGLDLSIQPGGTATLGSGTLVLVSFAAGDQLSVTFQSAEPTVAQQPDGGVVGPVDGGGLGGGCRSIEAFTQYAQPQLAQACANCHSGGNGSATNAFDMTRISDLTPEGQAAACGQALSRVNRDDPSASSLFTTTAPGGGGHPFRFNGNAGLYDQFRSQILLWIVQE